MYLFALQNEVRNVGSIELICLICWLKIVMIIYVSFCTTCRKFRMWVVILGMLTGTDCFLYFSKPYRARFSTFLVIHSVPLPTPYSLFKCIVLFKTL